MAQFTAPHTSKKISRKKPRWDDREFLRINLELSEDRPMLFVIQDDLSTVLSHGILKLRSDGLFERLDEYGEEIFSDFRSRLLTKPMALCNLFMAVPSTNPEWWSIDPYVGCQYFPDKVLIRATATPFDLEDYT